MTAFKQDHEDPDFDVLGQQPGLLVALAQAEDESVAIDTAVAPGAVSSPAMHLFPLRPLAISRAARGALPQVPSAHLLPTTVAGLANDGLFSAGAAPPASG